MKQRWFVVLASMGVARLVTAQQASTPEIYAKAGTVMTVKTVPLHHLSSAEAVKLLSPYVRSPNGGVFEVSPSIRAVTIREIPTTFNEMITVLNTYDREPASVTLNFQLISANNTATRDPSLAPLDSLLRGVLKFTGYKLLGTSIAAASEHGRISQSLAGDDEPYSLTVDVDDLRVDGNNASVRLNVTLWKTAHTPVLTTGVTVPIGQTVVLGTTVTDATPQKALILTVRPQLAAAKR